MDMLGIIEAYCCVLKDFQISGGNNAYFVLHWDKTLSVLNIRGTCPDFQILFFYAKLVASESFKVLSSINLWEILNQIPLYSNVENVYCHLAPTSFLSFYKLASRELKGGIRR